MGPTPRSFRSTPDANAIKQYWRLVHQHTGRTLGQFVEDPTSVQIYGATGDLMLERTRLSAEAGVAVTVMPEHVAGFMRLGPVAAETDAATLPARH